MRTALAVATLTIAPVLANAQTLHDDFNAGSFDSKKWLGSQIQPDQLRFSEPGRCGAAAITVVTRSTDGGLDCPTGEVCQRAEVRNAQAAWPKYDGREVWYAFSFRIDGKVPSTGSARTVIGQWKAPKDDSPFVAQRFDNGVFHITVQDNDTRRVVARAEGDPDRMLLAQQQLSQLDAEDPNTIQKVRSLQALYLLKHDQAGVFSQFFSSKLQNALQEKSGDAPEAKELSEALGLPSTLITTFEDLSFVAEPEKYLGRSDIEIIPEAKRLLPDPRKGWVDMVYRIKGGRLDNEQGPRSKGELDIWANGQKITSVRGNIGYKLKIGDKIDLVGPYFKFGLYRVKIPGDVGFHFDEFSQAPSKGELAPVCRSE